MAALPDGRRRLSPALSLFLAALIAAGRAEAATITVVNGDGAGEGFNDPTPVAALPGNAATTRGQQRLNAFAAGAAYWANRLASPVTIVVNAQMNALSCSPSGGILGGASAVNAFANFPSAPFTGTWYASALANALRTLDLDPGFADINATFNSAVDSDPSCITGLDWWYGIGSAAPAGTISFIDTVRHEIAHGLGFATFTNGATGQPIALGFPTIYDRFLEDHSTGKLWHQMTNGERQASAIDTGDLHWVGAQALAAGVSLVAGRHPGGHIQMYAPNPHSPGSSVSHWNTALVPDELMEPFATATMADVVTTSLLRDVGWALLPAGACVPDADTACLAGGRFDVGVTFQSATQSGNAQVMTFGGQRAENNESVFFTFFSGTNFEMGLKVLDACGINGKFWVFVSGLTDQGWVVTIRDTQTGAVKTYSNQIGQLSATFADTTQALSCQ
jgi:hypothetical protein